MQTKILVIEDDVTMRENTSELLSLSGYEVEVAENGKIGVEKVSTFKPDLIICDIMMPELDGYGVLYILSRKPETASIPFIFLTAKTEKADFRQGMSLGADDYLTKPFEDMELMNAVEGRLKKYEIVKKEFKPDANGLQDFMKEAEGMDAIRNLTNDRKRYAYKPKEFLYREGDYANFLYFIEKGQVKTFKMNDDAKEYILETYEAGDFLGYKALLENRPYNEFASPLENTEVCKIPGEDFLKLIYNNRDVSARFIKMMSRNISHKEEQLIQLAYDSVKRRIAQQLKDLFEESKDQALKFSRTDLANMVGTSKETLVRSLTNLKEDGVIETNGQEITLKDPQRLEQLLSWS